MTRYTPGLLLWYLTNQSGFLYVIWYDIKEQSNTNKLQVGADRPIYRLSEQVKITRHVIINVAQLSNYHRTQSIVDPISHKLKEINLIRHVISFKFLLFYIKLQMILIFWLAVHCSVKSTVSHLVDIRKWWEGKFTYWLHVLFEPKKAGNNAGWANAKVNLTYHTFFLPATIWSVVGLVDIPSNKSIYSVVRYRDIVTLLRNIWSLTSAPVPSNDPLNMNCKLSKPDISDRKVSLL